MSKEKIKRISFNEYEAEHIYELALEHFCCYDFYNEWGIVPDCCSCSNIKKKLEKCLGEKVVKCVKRAINKAPYCRGIKKK